MITTIFILSLLQLICMIILLTSFFVKSITEKIVGISGTVFISSSFINTIITLIYLI